MGIGDCERRNTQKKFNYFFIFKDDFAEKQIQLGLFTKEGLDKKEEKIKENILSKSKNYLLKNSSFVLYIIISFIWVAQEITMFILFDFFKV